MSIVYSPYWKKGLTRAQPAEKEEGKPSFPYVVEKRAGSSGVIFPQKGNANRFSEKREGKLTCENTITPTLGGKGREA